MLYLFFSLGPAGFRLVFENYFSKKSLHFFCITNQGIATQAGQDQGYILANAIPPTQQQHCHQRINALKIAIFHFVQCLWQGCIPRHLC